MSFFNGVGGGGVRAFIGLGSNLGDRAQSLDNAVQFLARSPGIRILRISSYYETEPWGVKKQPRFLNAAVEIETGLLPETLLETCKRIEADLGRKPGPVWGPRVADLDILLYGDRICQSVDLEIPHPRLFERRFVLAPLAEIASEVRIPGIEETVGTALKQCPDAGDVRLVRKAKGDSG